MESHSVPLLIWIKVIRSSVNGKGQKMIQLTTSVLLRIAKSRLDGKPIRTTFDTDRKVIRSSVNGKGQKMI